MAQEGVCWGADGKQWTNNKQCPGSSACCEERNNRFPRVKRCEDGSYCCSEDDPGCCAGKRGVFLDSKGNIEDDVTSSTVALVETTSSAETASPTTTAASTTASSDPSPKLDDTEPTNTGTTDNGQGMKIGLGVGAPAAAIVAGLCVWLFLRKRTAKHQDQSTAASHPPMYHYSQPGGPSEISQSHLYQQQYPQPYGHYPEVGDQRTKSPPTVQELQG
ncbi:uncharacterized protein FFB14_10855 [Fusarium fujikuroi]|nr:uncharacterized protein FFB14_10855 [Fusarium fujikuroi]